MWFRSWWLYDSEPSAQSFQVRFPVTRKDDVVESVPRRTTLLTLAAASLIFPLYAAIVWFTSWKEGASQSENVAAYHGYFPGFIQNASFLTWLSLLCSILAIILSIAALLGKKTKPRCLAVLLLLISVPITLWWGFTLLWTSAPHEHSGRAETTAWFILSVLNYSLTRSANSVIV